eukprot:10282653-Karenia_brevis.AAC.1
MSIQAAERPGNVKEELLKHQQRLQQLIDQEDIRSAVAEKNSWQKRLLEMEEMKKLSRPRALDKDEGSPRTASTVLQACNDEQEQASAISIVSHVRAGHVEVSIATHAKQIAICKDWQAHKEYFDDQMLGALQFLVEKYSWRVNDFMRLGLASNFSKQQQECWDFLCLGIVGGHCLKNGVELAEDEAKATRAFLAQATASYMSSLDADYEQEAKKLVDADDYDSAASLKEEWLANRGIVEKRLRELESAGHAESECTRATKVSELARPQESRMEDQSELYQHKIQELLKEEDFEGAARLKEKRQQRVASLQSSKKERQVVDETNGRPQDLVQEQNKLGAAAAQRGDVLAQDDMEAR